MSNYLIKFLDLPMWSSGYHCGRDSLPHVGAFLYIGFCSGVTNALQIISDKQHAVYIVNSNNTVCFDAVIYPIPCGLVDRIQHSHC